jgi:hypothetical protein
VNANAPQILQKWTDHTLLNTATNYGNIVG